MHNKTKRYLERVERIFNMVSDPGVDIQHIKKILGIWKWKYEALRAVRDETGASLLHAAAGEGAQKTLEWLVDEVGLMPDVADAKGVCPLHMAVQSGPMGFGMVQALLDRHADPNAQTSDGNTALHQAIGLGYGPTAVVLLDAGASSDIPNRPPQRLVPAQVAVINNNIDMLRLLYDKGASMRFDFEGQSCSLLPFAAHYDRPDVAIWLLDQGLASVDDFCGDFTAAHIAVQRGHDAVFKVLVDAGADVELESQTAKNSVLALAAGIGDPKIVHRVFQANETGFYDQGGKAMSPMELLIDGDRLDVLKRLHEADRHVVHYHDQDDYALLHIVAAHGGPKIAQWLLDEGLASIDERCKGETPFLLAAKYGQTEMVALLASYGADINATRSDGHGAAYLAVYNGHVDTAEALFDLGLSSHFRAPNGETLLHAAAYGCRVKMVELLLPRCGDDLDVVTDNGQTMRAMVDRRRFPYTNDTRTPEQRHACGQIIKMVDRYGQGQSHLDRVRAALQGGGGEGDGGASQPEELKGKQAFPLLEGDAPARQDGIAFSNPLLFLLGACVFFFLAPFLGLRRIPCSRVGTQPKPRSSRRMTPSHRKATGVALRQRRPASGSTHKPGQG